MVDFPGVAPKELANELEKAGVVPSQRLLLATLTESVTAATELIADDWLGDAQAKVGQWFTACCEGDERAFVRVQTELVPLATNRERQGIVLDMLVAVWHDALRLQTTQLSNDQLAYPQAAKVSQRVATQLTTDQLVNVMTLCLGTRSQLAGNINFQTILEALTLRILEQTR